MGSPTRSVLDWPLRLLQDMCNAADIEPIVTTTAEGTFDAQPELSKPGEAVLCCEPSDMADFVEYCWGECIARLSTRAILAAPCTPHLRQILCEDHTSSALTCTNAVARLLPGDSTTKWGAQRAADGHPLPYRVKYIELGNEQVSVFHLL